MTTDHREHLSEAELGVLKHVREHSRGEPSAAVDGLILAAASHAAQQPVAPSGWQRMQHWLFAAGHGHYLYRGVRRDYCRLGIQLEIRFSGCAAGLRSDGEL